jgi:hypothetical protein
MNRRSFSLALAAIVGIGLSAPLAAKTLSERVERALKRDGWRDIEITRTLLGRTRVTARKGDARREIILNTRTGEVLRDILIHDQGGTGSVFDEDDDEDDDEDRERDRDEKKDDD